MALAPISSSNLSNVNQPTVERNRQERDVEADTSQQNQINQNAPVERQDNQTTAQPIQATSETDRPENDPRLQQQTTDRQQAENSADNNLGSQIDITV